MMLAEETTSFASNVVYPLLGWLVLAAIMIPVLVAFRRAMKRQRMHFERTTAHMARVEEQLERIAQAAEQSRKGV